MEKIRNPINSGLVLSEIPGGIRFGTDAVLVSDFVRKGKNGVDLGAGSGVISLILLSMGKAEKMVGIEKQKEYFDLATENAKSNGFEGRFEVCLSDVKDIKNTLLKNGAYDFVVTNPPYLPENSGKKNDSDMKFISFHETTAGIDGFAKAAKYLLKSGGRFYAVYRPEYISKLISAMESHGIKLKRMKFVHPYFPSSPSLVLVDGRKDGENGAVIEPPLYIYKSKSCDEYTDEMKEIYNALEVHTADGDSGDCHDD